MYTLNFPPRSLRKYSDWIQRIVLWTFHSLSPHVMVRSEKRPFGKRLSVVSICSKTFPSLAPILLDLGDGFVGHLCCFVRLSDAVVLEIVLAWADAARFCVGGEKTQRDVGTTRQPRASESAQVARVSEAQI